MVSQRVCVATAGGGCARVVLRVSDVYFVFVFVFAHAGRPMAVRRHKRCMVHSIPPAVLHVGGPCVRSSVTHAAPRASLRVPTAV